MNTSRTHDRVVVIFTPHQIKALVDLIDRAHIQGRDAPLIVSMLESIGNARAITPTDTEAPS